MEIKDLIYGLVDMGGWRRWAHLVQPAGLTALLIFILGPILSHLLSWSATILNGFELHGWLGAPFGVGLARALGFTVLVVWRAEVLRRVGLRLRV